MTSIGVGVVGLGFMGRRHALNASRLEQAGEACRLVSVTSKGVRTIGDLRGSTVEGNIGSDEPAWPDASDPEIATDFDTLLENGNVDLVVIATTTPDHIDMSIAALHAGKHVLVEKPVAISAAEVSRLRDVVSKYPNQRCMPAHVMRYWPGWTDIASAVRDSRYGRVLSATFQRLGSIPDWNLGFYSDLTQSGGALADLHVHDVDYILHCFGDPDRIHAVGDAMHVTACFGFENGPGHVVAEAAWDRQPAAGFRMRCEVNFERATMEFDSARQPPLVLCQGDSEARVDSSIGDGYEAELRALVRAIVDDTSCPVTIDDALAAARVIDQERDILARS